MSEQRTLLVYSNSHLHRRDAELLDQFGEQARDDWPPTNTLFIADASYGWLLWVGNEGVEQDAEAEFARLGFTPALPAVLRHAHERGAEYVLFDCDACEDDELPVHDGLRDAHLPAVAPQGTRPER
jgi:hypothetical protein